MPSRKIQTLRTGVCLLLMAVITALIYSAFVAECPEDVAICILALPVVGTAYALTTL